MQKKIIVTLNRISFLQTIDIDSILKIFLKNPYNEDDGVGFVNAEIFDEVLEATLIKRVPTSLREFDIHSGDFIQREIFIFDEITFYLDLNNNLIYSFNSASKLNKVKSVLKNCIKNRLTYSNIEINPFKIICNLVADNFECRITEITIKKFIYKQGAQGKYVAHVFDPNIGQVLMNEYMEEIQKITIDVSSNLYNDFALTVSTGNTLGIKSEEDDFLRILGDIKNKIK
jgi:hypothetical protein